MQSTVQPHRALLGLMCKFHLRGNLSPNAIDKLTHHVPQELCQDFESQVNKTGSLSKIPMVILAQWDVLLLRHQSNCVHHVADCFEYSRTRDAASCRVAC